MRPSVHEVKRFVVNKAIPVVVVGSVAVSGCSSEATPVLPEPAVIEYQAPVILPPDQCIEPTQSDLQAVERLNNEPENPGLSIQVTTSNANPYGKGGKDYEDMKGGGGDEGADLFRTYLAGELGLTFFDADDVLNDLNNAYTAEFIGGRTDSAPRDFIYYLEQANDYMSHFGVNIKVGGSPDRLDYGNRYAFPQELETNAAKQTVMNIVTAYSKLPLQLVDFVGLKEIVLTGGARTEAAGYAYGDNEHDTYNIILPALDDTWPAFSPQQNLHEFTHLFDAKTCGTKMNIDEKFTAMNGLANIYSDLDGEKNPTYSLNQNFSDDQFALTKAQYAADPNHDYTHDCATKLTVAANKAKTIIADKHAHNPQEDKATLGELIMNYYDYTLVTDKDYAFHYKLKYLMARMYHELPNVVTYFSETSFKMQTSEAVAPRC